MRHEKVFKLHNDGLSPNGKALDSDSSIFQVRILVAQFIRRSRFDRLFYYFGMRAPIYPTDNICTAHSHSALLHVRVALARYTPARMLVRLRVNSHELRACRCAALVGTRKKSSSITREALSYAAEKIRTPDTLVRSQVLYPAELRPHLCCFSQQMIFYRSF